MPTNILIKEATGQVRLLEEAIFEKDQTENNLHTIVEKNPSLILSEIWSNNENLRVISSKKTLSSGKEVDLIVCNSSGNLAIIELKRGRTPRDAIAQLLDYASTISEMNIQELRSELGVDIEKLKSEFQIGERDFESFETNFQKSIKEPQLLLVSYDISDDIKRVAEYLRQHKIQINCVEFDYYRKNTDEVFVPKIIGSEKTRALIEEGLSPTQKIYKNFFSELLERCKKKRPGITDRQSTKDQWCSLPIGHSGIHIEWSFEGSTQHKKLKVSLDFELKNASENRRLIKKFRENKETYEKTIGEELEFMENWGKRGWSRVWIQKDVGKRQDIEENEELKKWAVSKALLFFDAFKEDLDRYVAETA